MLVRYGLMGNLGWFEHEQAHVPKQPCHAVVKTERGLELGKVVGNFSYKHGNFRCSKQQIESYYGKDEKECPIYSGGSFVRFGTHEDVREAEHLQKESQKEMATCKKFIKEFELPMKLIDAEHLFGGERIIFYFTSPGRVDFRELVKKLAKEYQTRIELRQIGSRDEAKLLADFETCGQECCCRRFLKILEPVNMRMAKIQKATLDPSKISGHCGRLKCCLRYEDQTYQELKNNLPRRNSQVQTPKGRGKVIDTQILTQLVEVLYEDSSRGVWPVEEIKPLRSNQNQDKSQPRNNDKNGTNGNDNGNKKENGNGGNQTKDIDREDT